MIGQAGRGPAKWASGLFVLGVFASHVRGETLTEALFERALGVDTVAPFIFTLEQTAARGTDFPATATTPGFTYRYNPELNLFERAPGTLGPAFLERGDTIGQGRSDVGISYLYARFNELDGDDLDDFSDGFVFDDPSFGDPVAGTVRFEDFSLTTHAFYLFATHGLTSRWDVNLLFPVYLTVLDARFRVDAPTGTFRGRRLDVDESAAGVGDLQLRTKYSLYQEGNTQMAAGLTLRIPTGEEGDFHGIGDYTVTPQWVVSYAEGSYDLHLSLGVETNADDLERTRGRYGVGGSLGIFKRLTANLDIIGTSSFVDDEKEELIPGGDVTVLNAQRGRFTHDPVEFRASGPDAVLLTEVSRSDIVDVAVGFKVNIVGELVGFVSFIVPITSDGLRADFVTSTGLEMAF